MAVIPRAQVGGPNCNWWGPRAKYVGPTCPLHEDKLAAPASQ